MNLNKPLSLRYLFNTSTLGLFILAGALSSPALALAINYTPGQTLDPACTPTDPTCIVISPSATNQAAIFVATSTTATSTFAGNTSVAGNASSTNATVSGTLTVGTLSGILKAVAGVVTTALVNLSTDVTGILGITNGGTGLSATPTYGQVLVGQANGTYALIATSSLGIAGGGGGTWGSITGTLANQTDLQNALNAKFSLANWYATTTDALAQGTTNKYFSNALAQGAISVSGTPLTYSSGVIGINQANASQSGFLASSDWTTFNGKLSSTSLQTSALIASIVADHTGSGALAFATSPTFAGTPTFSGGAVNYSTNSTTTVPNGNPYAWTVATSTTATPLIEVDTSGGSTPLTSLLEFKG